jgi:hypothetical protein
MPTAHSNPQNSAHTVRVRAHISLHQCVLPCLRVATRVRVPLITCAHAATCAHPAYLYMRDSVREKPHQCAVRSAVCTDVFEDASAVWLRVVTTER